MKKIIAIMLTACALSISASAATPLYKPVKLPKIKITVPHYDFSYAVEKYLEEHPLDIW
jgi:hypothetical protein